MNNVLVYALADKYNLPGLKSIAKSKFIESTRETRWPYSNFAAVIKAVYTTTPAHDHGLRDPIVHICASHVLELALDNKLAATIKEIGDLSFAIMISLSKKRGEDQESIEEDRSRRKQILEGARMIEAAVRADLIKTKAELFTG